MIPVILILLAVLSSAALAYGTLPAWGQFSWGVDVIYWTRLLQWPLLAVCLVCCLGLVGLIVAGKRKLAWVIGLVPVLVLFADHYIRNPLRGFWVNGQPSFTAAASAGVAEEDWVIGLVLDGQAYAYPYARIYSTPVLVQDVQARRLLLIWNPFANYAMARRITHELRAPDFDLVSMPANATLVYNSKHMEMICGITGLTLKDQPPTAFEAEVPVWRMPWKQWLAQHPATQVLEAPAGASAQAPGRPLEPAFPLPPPSELALSVPPRTQVVVIPTRRPVAILSDKLTIQPANLSSPDAPELVFRDPVTGQVRAFIRRVGELEPRFEPAWLRLTEASLARLAEAGLPEAALTGLRGLRDREFTQRPQFALLATRAVGTGVWAEWSDRIVAAAIQTASAGGSRKGVYMIDSDTQSGWSVEGVAIDGRLAGQRLEPLPTADHCQWGVMKAWMKDLILVDPTLGMK